MNTIYSGGLSRDGLFQQSQQEDSMKIGDYTKTPEAIEATLRRAKVIGFAVTGGVGDLFPHKGKDFKVKS
jgi:hypothetical protein